MNQNTCQYALALDGKGMVPSIKLGNSLDFVQVNIQRFEGWSRDMELFAMKLPVIPSPKLDVLHLVPKGSFDIASGLPSLYNQEHPFDIVGVFSNLPVPLFQLPDIG